MCCWGNNQVEFGFSYGIGHLGWMDDCKYGDIINNEKIVFNEDEDIPVNSVGVIIKITDGEEIKKLGDCLIINWVALTSL